MSHPWVYSATVAPDGSKITFMVEVTDVISPPATTQGVIEITGDATQINGAFASFSCTTDRSAAYQGSASDKEQAGRYFVNVDAYPTPGQPFLANLDTIVWVRVSKVWVTVLGPGGLQERTSGQAATAGTTWEYETDAQISATGSS